MGSRSADGGLIIFLRLPVAGKVKTRLAATVGPHRALDIYRELVSKTLTIAKHTGVPVYLYYEGEIPRAQSRDPFFEYRVQASGNLGDKIFSALSDILDLHARAVIIGSDCPTLTPDLILNSFYLLDDFDLVLGPAQDGGYYLLGCKSAHRSIFENIAWGTANVLHQTEARCTKEGLTFTLLPILSDIDTEDDWENYLTKTGTR